MKDKSKELEIMSCTIERLSYCKSNAQSSKQS